jgi:hypothetical protein
MIYLLAFLYPQLHENFTHSEEKTELCTLEEESNACHQAVYHFESSTACEHSNHLSEIQHECELCDSIHHQNHISVKADYSLSINSNTINHNIEYYSSIVSSPILFFSVRGPPYLLLS